MGTVFGLRAFSGVHASEPDLRTVQPLPPEPYPLEFVQEFVRPGFTGLMTEQDEREVSNKLNPLINPQDPFTIRITSLDLVHKGYLGR